MNISAVPGVTTITHAVAEVNHPIQQLCGQDFNYVAGDYVLAIEKAGGIPLLIPQTYDFENLKPLLELCDGVLVSGGHDVDPLRYGQRNLYSGTIAVERDEQGKLFSAFVSACRKDA